MASKIDLAGIQKLALDISKKEGSESIFSLSGAPQVKVKRWSTGLIDLDEMLGGGMPEGRMIELYGAESAGKTSLLYHLCACHPICLDIPIEGTFEKERAMIFGNRPKQMLVYNRCKYGEQAFNKLILFAERGIPLVATDSVSYMQPKEDVEKILKSVHNEYGKAQSDVRVGGVANLMNKYLPVLKEVIEVTGTTVIFVNQIRDTMGALPFGEKTHTPGGHQFHHTMSIRIHVARKEWIKIPNYNPMNAAKEEPIGIIMKCKTVKNKTYDPFKECELPLIFDRGFVDFTELEDVRKEIMRDRKERYK